MHQKATALALAKQLLYDCEGSGSITLEKGALKIVLDAFIDDWNVMQTKTRQGFEKVK